jgi:hypothetical protein
VPDGFEHSSYLDDALVLAVWLEIAAHIVETHLLDGVGADGTRNGDYSALFTLCGYHRICAGVTLRPLLLPLCNGCRKAHSWPFAKLHLTHSVVDGGFVTVDLRSAAFARLKAEPGEPMVMCWPAGSLLAVRAWNLTGGRRRFLLEAGTAA